MPRVYWATMFLDSLATIVGYNAFLARAVHVWDVAAILVCLGLIYVNEKTAVLENMLSGRLRRSIGTLVLGALGLLLLAVWMLRL